METVLRIALIAAGIIHLYPSAAALVPSLLSGLYGVPDQNADIRLLLRHRAVLFGLLGVGLILAALDRAFYLTAVIAGLVSMVSYIALTVGTTNPRLRRVMLIDVVLSVLLVIAYILYRVTR